MLESLAILAMRAMILLYASRSSPARNTAWCGGACFLPPPCVAEASVAGHEATRRRRSTGRKGTRE
jgi:hypothetical protein